MITFLYVSGEIIDKITGYLCNIVSRLINLYDVF